ncbi:hypothetical protein ACIBEJ_10055 [Nonomuraea sp. NPDC050790]|uniref:hypothetical protein n=1 Tax=Nonomuraea sp. NPDC050790 TaxID=3364371 RepID=UPI0037AC66F2
MHDDQDTGQPWRSDLVDLEDLNELVAAIPSDSVLGLALRRVHVLAAEGAELPVYCNFSSAAPPEESF